MRRDGWLSWAWISVGLALLALNVALLRAPTAWIESVYMTRLWPAWPQLTAQLHTASPLPLTLPTLVLSALAALALGLSATKNVRRASPTQAQSAGPARWRRVVPALAVWAALLVLTFVPAWGVSYRRAPLAHGLGLSEARAQVDAEVLVSALEHLSGIVADAAPLRPLAALLEPGEVDAAVSAAAACVARADEAVVGRPVNLSPRVRRLPAGSMLRWGYAGIALPWLLEAHVDAGLPPASFIAVAAHELAHTAGWGPEADTDALAVLAGVACDDAFVRYALALYGVQVLERTLRPALEGESALRARTEAALAALPSAAHGDRAALVEASARWRVQALARVATVVNDGYLRSQGVAAGVADYDAAGSLVAAALTACQQSPTKPWCR